MPCCHLTRRQVLQLAAVAGSASLVTVTDPERSYAAAAGSPLPPRPMNLEIVTLTESSVVVTWYSGVPGKTGDQLQPHPMDTELRLGTHPAKLHTVLHRSGTTPYHYAEVRGLEPGRTYYYQARSNGMAATPALNAAGNPLGVATTTRSGLHGLTGVFAFTTAHPPKGRHLFTLALANDVHMGETVAGLLKTLPGGGEVPPGVHQVAGQPPYPEVMAKAMVADAKDRGAHTLLVAGDLTSEAAPGDLRRSKRILERFGTYRHDVFVARGNHDRGHAGAQYASCSVSAVDPSTRDCFVDVFDHDRPTWFATEKHGLRIIGLDTYDKAGNGGDNGGMSARQLAWFTRKLAQDPDRPTLVLGHHPVTLTSDVVNDEPLIFDLALDQSRQVEALYAKTPGVFFHHAGHTHRNYRSASTTARHVTFQEVGATKEYPGGFSLLRVHEGGYAMNFYKTRSHPAREWSERTRGEYAGAGASAFYMTGTIGDRNYVVARDLSGLRSAAHDSGTASDGGSHVVRNSVVAGGAAVAGSGVVAAGVRHHAGHGTVTATEA
jgi:hypothetical protein